MKKSTGWNLNSVQILVVRHKPKQTIQKFLYQLQKKKIQTCLQYILQNVLNMKKVFGQGIKKTSSSAGILNRLLFGRPGPGI